MKYDRFGSSGHIILRFFLVCKGCREKHTHFNKKLFSLNTLFHEGAPLPLAKNCTPLTGFYQNYGSFFGNEITSRDSVTFSQAHLHKRHEGCCIAATALVLRLCCYFPTTFFINRIRIAASCARVALSAGFRVPSV